MSFRIRIDYTQKGKWTHQVLENVVILGVLWPIADNIGAIVCLNDEFLKLLLNVGEYE